MKLSFTEIKTLLLENQTIKRTIFKNTFWITLGIGISKILKFILIVYVVRLLGATEYGKFSFAVAFISLFVAFDNLGMFNIVTREFAREKEKQKQEEFYSVVSLKLVLALGVLIMTFVGSFFITKDPYIQRVIWILAIFSLIGDFSKLIQAFFRAHQKMEYESWATILESLVVTVLGFFVIFKIPSVENLSYAYLFSALIALFFTLFLLHFKILPFRISWERKVFKKFLFMSWPLFLASLCSTIYTYIDSVIMGFLGQLTQAGWYNAAYRLIEFTTIPASVVTVSFYPVLSKFFKESKEKIQNIWDHYLGITFLIIVPIVLGGIGLASQIINFAYGKDFNSSVLALQILMVMSGIVSLVKSFSIVLLIFNHQKKILFITFMGAAISIILNLILIPIFSLYGAALSTVVTNLLILIPLVIYILKFTSIKPISFKLLPNLITIVFSGLVMFLIVSFPQVYRLNIFFSVLIAISIYFSMILFFKKFLRIKYI
jgi:O-antigen/teichoic acid export membrane protein